MEIISRKESKIQGLKRYFTGKPCKHGHVTERHTFNGICNGCHIEYRKNNKESVRKYDSMRNIKYRKRFSLYRKQYYINNKKLCNGLSKEWKKENPEKHTIHENKRRATKLQALPVWYEQEKHLINQLYTKSKELSNLWNIILHVDHIVPLQGENVCGLHCWANLQLLERSLNCSKGNKLEENQ